MCGPSINQHNLLGLFLWDNTVRPHVFDRSSDFEDKQDPPLLDLELPENKVALSMEHLLLLEKGGFGSLDLEINCSQKWICG